jgi:hypothetical protein
MPMLPSGRHIVLSPAPLVDLLERANQPGNVQKVMALKEWPELHPWIDVLYLLPEGAAGSRDDGAFSDNSLPAPPGMVAVKAGYRLNDWESRAAEWNDEDRVAMRQFLDERARGHYEQRLVAARDLQDKLRSPGAGFVTQVLAGWHDAGIHPAQEDGWEKDELQADVDPIVKELKKLSRRKLGAVYVRPQMPRLRSGCRIFEF